jgi:acetyltransferase-like isoleucine patch superfamily enzyme
LSRIYSFFLKPFFFRFGQRSLIGFPSRLLNIHRISLGSRVSIGANAWLNAIELDPSSQSPYIQIGDNTRIGDRCQINATFSVVIEPDVLIANNCLITDCDHSYAEHRTPIMHQPVVRKGDVLIKRGAWIGINVCIMPGVVVGTNSVVAANSVVLSDVPDFHIVAGSPARIVKKTLS